MDLNTCDRFLEEDCQYQGEIILIQDNIADAKHCQQLCQQFEVVGCHYWVFQENGEGKHDCSLLASDDRSCAMIGGPKYPNIKDCAPTTTTPITTTITMPTTTICSTTQLTIEETMPLEKTFGNETYCQAVNSTCSVCSCEDWEFNDMKTLAIQHNNTNIANIGLGSEYVLGVNFNGTFNTSSEIDDDYIGFIFGFQDPTYFYVVYASKFNASNGYYTQYQFRITKVHSIYGLNGPYMINAIFHPTSSIPNQTEILWKDTENRGWLRNKEYTWNLKFRPLNGQLRLALYEDSEILFDTGILTNNVENEYGKLGIFTRSQDETFWYDMWYECDNQPLI